MVSLDEFVNSSFQPHHQVLTASENEAVVASCVVASVDAAIRFNDSLFITSEAGKLTAPNQLMRPGETFAQSCQRLISDQLGITCVNHPSSARSRFVLKGVINHGLSGNNYEHRIGHCISITLTEAEAQQVPAGAWAKVKNIVHSPFPIYHHTTISIAALEEIFNPSRRILAEYGCTPFAPTPLRLSDEAYVKILDSRVLCCVDVLVRCNGKILLGLRSQKPAKDLYWILGGRMVPGETFARTAQRVLRREASLTIEDHKRFRYMGLKSYAWPDREQAPQDHGCHMIGHYMLIDITNEEAAQLAERPDFSEWRWIDTVMLKMGDLPTHEAMRKLARQSQGMIHSRP